jgi:hypothetical protein
VFCVEKNKELVVILPLIKKGVFGFSSYTNPGERFLEKSPLLMKENDKKFLKVLINYILGKGNIHLSEVSRDVSLSLQALYPKSVLSIISVNPYIDLSKDPLAQLSKENINKIRNRIIKNKGKLNHFHLRNNLEKEIQAVFDLEKVSYKKTKKKEIFNDELSRRFFKNLVSICDNYVTIDFLTFGGKPFVSATGIICKDRYYAYHTCYLRDYKYLMPGKSILLFVLSKLKSKGVEVFDFGRGLSNFKKEFTRDYLMQYDFYLSKNNLINTWWEFINYIRRIRIVFLKTENSKDYLYLFKNL